MPDGCAPAGLDAWLERKRGIEMVIGIDCHKRTLAACATRSVPRSVAAQPRGQGHRVGVSHCVRWGVTAVRDPCYHTGRLLDHDRIVRRVMYQLIKKGAAARR